MPELFINRLSRFSLAGTLLLLSLPLTTSAQIDLSGMPLLTPPPQMSPLANRLQRMFNRALKLQTEKQYRRAIQEYRDYLRQGKAAQISAAAELPAYGNLAFCYSALGERANQETALKEVLKRDSKNVVSYAQLAVLKVATGQMKAARDYAQKALSLKPPPNIAFTTEFALGTASLQLNDLKTAISSFNHATQLSPKNAQIRFNYAIALARANRTAEALTQAEKARDLAPNLVQPRLFIASTLQQQKRYSEALTNYNAVLKRDPNNLLALFNRGAILQQLGRSDEALDAYLETTKRYPANYAAQMNTAQLYLSAQNWVAAKYRFGLALKIVPNNPPALAGLGRSELEDVSRLLDPKQKKEGFAQAEVHLKRAVAGDPKNTLLQDQLSVLYERSGRYSEAIALYKDRITATPKDVRLYYRVATLYKEQRKIEEAATVWKAYRLQNPDDETSYREIAENYELTGRKPEALAEMEIYLKRKPNDGTTLLYTARLLSETGKTEEAKARYRRATELDASGNDEPDPKLRPSAIAFKTRYKLDGWRGLAQIAQKESKFEEAILDWQKVKALDAEQTKRDKIPSDPAISRSLAAAYGLNKQPDKAIAEYRALSLANPDETTSLNEIARIEEAQGHIGEAVSALRQVVERSKEKLSAQLKIPELYRRLNQPENAIGEYEALSKTYPKDTQLLSSLAQVYETTGKDDKALATYNTILKADANAKWAIGKKAAVLVRLKRFDEARGIYETTLDQNPDDIQTVSDISRLYTLEKRDSAYLDWLKTRLDKTPASRALTSYVIGEFIRQKKEEEGWETLKSVSTKYKELRNVQEVYASTLQGHGRVAQAIPILQAVADKNKKDLEAQVAVTDALEQNKQFDEATVKLEALLKSTNYTESGLDIVRRRLAERYVVQKKNAQAITLYQSLYSRTPADIGTATTLVDLLDKEGRDRESVPVLISLLQFKGFPDSIKGTIRSKLGSIYEKIGNKTEAEAQFREALKVNAQDKIAQDGLKRLTGK